ncbi:MAG: hypothetical protein HFE57_07070 [Firmicutes bacterium]|jgi:hypothetical protein|nr:hypothetical protein [Bacillota bacterium]
MEIRENIKVYHCNDKQRCEKFLKEDNYLIWSEEDGIWLGSGMYFWDNLANAQYWKGQKKRKTNNRKPLSIVSAHIYIDNLLDLSDINTCNVVDDIWEAYCKTSKKPSQGVKLGEKLNILFKDEDFKKYFSKYTVIRIIGKYNYTPETSLFYYDIKSNRIEPILSAKYIYNVKNSNCIFNKELIRE